jgi:uncharacterized membrane protein
LIGKGVIIAFIVIAALITALPFILNFESIAEGADFTHTKTPLWQLAVLWGMPAVLTLVFAFVLTRVKAKLARADLFIISILTASWILIFIPEFVYVKDIYIASHYRANTMFKITYQAFVMFSLTAGYIAIRTISLLKDTALKIFVFSFFVLMFGSVVYYAYIATNSYYGDLKIYRGLRGDTWLQNKYPPEYQALLWLQDNVDGQPVILEAAGDSYTEYNVISSYSGLPTVSGWFVHEWLWRGKPEYPQERVNDIIQIYTSSDIAGVKQLLGKYRVEYVIVGHFEREKYPNLIESKFEEIGERVFQSGGTSIYRVQ